APSRDPPSFPTRRSSDLSRTGGRAGRCAASGRDDGLCPAFVAQGGRTRSRGTGEVLDPHLLKSQILKSPQSPYLCQLNTMSSSSDRKSPPLNSLPSPIPC